MSFVKELNLLLTARYSLIYIATFEEDRLEYMVKNCLKLGKQRTLYIWDFIEGFFNRPNLSGYGKRNPMQALDFVETLTVETPAIFLLKDFHKFFNEIAIVRKIRNLSRLLQTQSKTIIITAPEFITIPIEIRELFTNLEFQLPNIEEIRNELERLLCLLDKSLTKEDFEDLVNSCQGLSIERIRRILSKIIAKKKDFNSSIISIILEEKQQIIKQTQILEFCTTAFTLDDVGGLINLKNWLKQRSGAFSQLARNYGLPIPKGLLLVGIQGTGKSLISKVVSNEWRLPLLRLDFGCLFAGIVGESEFRVREMIRITEALAPCILWIDEIDKSFRESESRGDSGTTNRVLATFITWLSEKTSSVFVIATANNFEYLPLELVRKGRFDEIFFIGLPIDGEREKIFQIILEKIRPERINEFDIDILVKYSNDFSGAEIFQAITEAMYIAFNEKREFTTQDILESLYNIIPLAQVEQAKIQALQRWVESGRFRAASHFI